MFTYKEIKKNRKLVRRFFKKYRSKLAICEGLIAEWYEWCNYEDYVKFYNGLPLSEITGIHSSSGLFSEERLNFYKNILKGKMTFEDYVKNEYGESIYNELMEKLNKES